jgi:Na+/H+ antiporter NhaD/arsenite permease-like protein
MGIASAFLMNDTMAIIGTPVVIMLAKSHNIQAKPLLLALAFAITIGGVMSPIGNPQNLLIATGSNMHNAFADFFTHLLIPTLINLLVAFALLKYFYKIDTKELKPIESKITDEKLARIVKISLFLLIVFIFLKILVVSSGLLDFRLTYIALIAAAPIILFSKKRFDIIRNIDWHTLIFFVSMFVLMQSVWEAGLFQTLISGNILSIGLILVLGVVISQFISNVPMVALYLPMLVAAGASSKEFVALAAGSTIAGNLFILGAASNIIIIQNAERYGETITFKEFAKIGIPLTIVNIFVYWVFLTFI